MSVLLDRQVPEDVETAASVESQSSITISFRKRIQGITVSVSGLLFDCSRLACAEGAWDSNASVHYL